MNEKKVSDLISRAHEGKIIAVKFGFREMNKRRFDYIEIRAIRILFRVAGNNNGLSKAME